MVIRSRLEIRGAGGVMAFGIQIACASSICHLCISCHMSFTKDPTELPVLSFSLHGGKGLSKAQCCHLFPKQFLKALLRAENTAPGSSSQTFQFLVEVCKKCMVLFRLRKGRYQQAQCNPNGNFSKTLCQLHGNQASQST